VTDPADPFRERARRTTTLRLQVLGGAFEFVAASKALLDLARWAYGGLPAHRFRPRAPRLTVHLRLAERGESERLFASGAGLLTATASGSDAVIIAPSARSALVIVGEETLANRYLARYELLEFAVCTLAARSQSLLALHAACVGHEGRGLLLAGDTGAGKSTATLHALLEGFELLAEDSVFVEPRTLRATGVANFLHLRTDGVHGLAAAQAFRVARAPTIRRRSGIEKHEVDVRATRLALAPRPLRLAGLVLLSPARARGPRLLRRLEGAAAVRRLARLQPYAARQRSWAAFARRLDRVPAFELRRGERPEAAVDALREAMR
jgi:hypothetical protein